MIVGGRDPMGCTSLSDIYTVANLLFHPGKISVRGVVKNGGGECWWRVRLFYQEICQMFGHKERLRG